VQIRIYTGLFPGTDFRCLKRRYWLMLSRASRWRLFFIAFYSRSQPLYRSKNDKSLPSGLNFDAGTDFF
jgi:hypothetical protein